MVILSKLPLALAAVSILGLSACVESLPGQGTANTEQGAVIGAVAGGLLGAATGDGDDRGRRAVIGAVVGGGLGALAGNNLDRQEAELRQQLGAGVGIVNNGTSLVVTLSQDILFATDSATLTGSLQNELRTVAGSINRYPDTTVNVIGHTDNVGDRAYNQTLSERRAQAVSSVLVSAGVAPSRVRAIGRGMDVPVASNVTPEGRQQNRRVEIVITPNG